MARGNAVRDVTVFVSLYLVLSLPPFLYLNQGLSSLVNNVALVASLGTAGLAIVAGLVLANEGVTRYTQFLFSISDAFSALVDLSFVLAAVSWWAVPEAVMRLALGLGLAQVITAIIICHVPMVLLLSLMTIVGEVQKQ